MKRKIRTFRNGIEFMDNRHWILDELGNPEPATLEVWARWFENNRDRIVKQEMVGDVKVSTVFLGLDHNWGQGPPVLWETMVFGGKMDQHQERCAGNREQAEAMHESVLEKVKNDS